MKFGFKRPCVFFRKRSLKMLNLSDLRQRSINDLDLGLSYYLFDYNVPTFTSQTSIVSWKSTA